MPCQHHVAKSATYDDISEDERMKEFCKHLIKHPRYQTQRSFNAGSRSEILGQELLFNHYGLNKQFMDVDIMLCRTDIYVCPCREPVPEQVRGKVIRVYSDRCHPGYVKLRYEEDNIEFKRIDIVSFKPEDVKGPAVKFCTGDLREHNKIIQDQVSQDDWVDSQRGKATVVQDQVVAVHNPHWPVEAGEWISRPRVHSFPPKSTIKEIVRYGCDFVEASHKLSADKNEWRFSFSKAELIIIHRWSTSQRVVYRTLHILNKIIKNTNKDSVLCTYYFKTLMLWATEKKPAEFWSEIVLVNSVCNLVLELADMLNVRCCPNYFIPSNNMIDHLTDSDLSADIFALYRQLQDTELISNLVNTSHVVEDFIKSKTHLIQAPVWMYTSLVISEQTDSTQDDDTLLFPSISSTLSHAPIFLELSDLWQGLNCHQKAAICAISSTKDSYLLKANKHFTMDSLWCRQVGIWSCSGRVRDSILPLWFLRSDDSESDLKVPANVRYCYIQIPDELNDIRIKADFKCLLYLPTVNDINNTVSGTDRHLHENICSKNETRIILHTTSTADVDTDDEFYEEFHGMSPTVNISWFINKAYLANFYYTAQRNYTATEETCDAVLNTYQASVCNRRYAERSFPVILSTDWTAGAHDQELQATVGLYSLCTFVLNKTDRSRSVCLGICPVLFAMYLKFRCCVPVTDESQLKRYAKCSIDIALHIEDCRGDAKIFCGKFAMQAARKVFAKARR